MSRNLSSNILLSTKEKQSEAEIEQISAHGFRHTHASLMFEAGAEIKDVQERLGHADIQTTSNIYTHVTESRNEKVMDKFIKFMSIRS